MPRKYPKGYLREFRSRVAKLKKAGIVSSKVDARGVRPSKHYKRLLSEFDSVIKGRQKTVKVTKKQAEYASDSGLRTKGNRVIIDNTPGSRIVKQKSDPFGYYIKWPDGIRKARIRKPKGITIDQYFDRLEAEIPNGTRGTISFTFFGGQSHFTFQTIYQARNYFLKYDAVQDLDNVRNKVERKQKEFEIIQAIEFYVSSKRDVDLVVGGRKKAKRVGRKKK